jgi:hypothetical protein
MDVIVCLAATNKLDVWWIQCPSCQNMILTWRVTFTLKTIEGSKYRAHHKGAPMFMKFDPYRVWCSIFYSKLVNCILFEIIVQHVRFVKDRGTCGSGERKVKIWIDFWKSPRFSLTSPLSQGLVSSVYNEPKKIRCWATDLIKQFSELRLSNLPNFLHFHTNIEII